MDAATANARFEAIERSLRALEATLEAHRGELCDRFELPASHTYPLAEILHCHFCWCDLAYQIIAC